MQTLNFMLETKINLLIKEMRSCNACKHHLPFEPNPIFQVSQEARILIVGQAPGLRAHLTNLPFNDQSGIRLRQWLGVSNEEFYNPSNFAIIPMGLCYPGTYPQGGDRPPCQECAPLWHPQLKPYLRSINIILLVGKYAHAYYLQQYEKSSVTETVASWRAYLPKFLPLPHPK